MHTSNDAMTKKDKLIARFKSLPRDFTYDELAALLGIFGFVPDNKGKTSGSRVIFWNEELRYSIMIHKPHPGNIVKPYAVKQVFEMLQSLGLI